jgi:hypothetical protein
LIRHGANAFQHLKWPEELGSKLGLGTISNATSKTVMKPQQYPVPYGKLNCPMGFVVAGHHVVLGQQQSLSNIAQELITLEQLFVQSCHPSQPWHVGH